MTADLLGHIKRLIFYLLILGFSNSVLFSQTDSTIIDKYARVISRSDYQVVVDDVSSFNARDTVLIIQMQGVAIDTSDVPGYGTGANQLVGIPGRYEFLIIQTIVPALKTITFGSKINKYDPAGNVQIIKVPFYNSFSSSKVITCKPWSRETKTGGVLAIMVGKTLTLNQNIDVSAKGFKGGRDTIGLGDCSSQSGISGKYSFPRSFQNAGYKGEGLATYKSLCHTCIPVALSPYLKGQGALFTGGGGGNGKFSGGGGGSNRGNGGYGGNEYYLCSEGAFPGGNPGVSVILSNPQLDTITGGVFMGGGGGASTKWAGSVSQPGGNGGGIVIIVTDQLNGNGNKIIADGGGVSTALLDAGAGGGGAGGSVIISSNSLTNVELSVRGGKGGNHLDDFGQGGGGGGGLIWISQKFKPATVDTTMIGGAAGMDTILLTRNATPGGAGLEKFNFKVQLSGFLFNSIRSSVSGNQIDSVCSNTIPPKILGTNPVGGKRPYIYIWEKSYDQITWIPLTNPDTTNYTPTQKETVSVWFRRTITDASTPTIITDYGKPVQIIVYPAIQNNIIVANPDTICYHGDPQLLKQGTPDLVVPTTKYLKYIWQDSTNGGVWGSELTAETAKEFDPAPTGVLTKDTWYRRTVISGSCINKGAIAKITVLPKIYNNTIYQSYDTICFGGNTDLVTVTGLGGGLSSDYRYQWESSTTSSSGPWIQVGVTLPSFDPDASVKLPVGDHFYRRIIFSGEQNACKDTSNTAVRKVWPVITNNNIKADQTIGYDSIPLKLTESSGSPLGGEGIYTYLWLEDAAPAPTGTNGSNTNSEYQPDTLKTTIYFRRIVNSSVCKDTSNSVKITVDLPISNNIISLTNSALDTIYAEQISSKLNGSGPSGGSGISNDYSFKWYKSLTGSASGSDWTLISDSTRISFFPGSLTQTYWFRRDVSSPALVPRSTYKSNFLKVTVLPKITNVNISSNQSVCYGYRPLQLKGSALLKGGDGKYKFTWQDSTSGHSWQNITSFVHCDSANYKPDALTSQSKYRRIVYSGKNDCGIETSNSVLVKVNPLPGKPDAGPDTTIYSIDNIFYMRAVKPLSGETGTWTVLDNGTASFINDAVYNTKVEKLSYGVNSFLWTVSTGFCELSDTVNIELLKGIFIPQGFSPNGDAYNNTFIIDGLILTDQYVDLKIVNGAGTEVFSTTNHNGQTLTDTWKDWDGKNSKGLDLSEGTYYYLLKVISIETGKVTKKSGFVILKRY